MKVYINKNTKSLATYTNFIPSDTSDLIELTNTQYQEYQVKTKQGYKPNFTIENDNVVITYSEDLKKAYKKELSQIKQWFIDNDWKVNKVFIGEWQTTDQRWLDYLSERAVKRTRQDELTELLKG